MTPHTGALLVNLGSPRSPAVADVRRYLREFLGDPYVVDLPGPLRRALLEGLILPLRSPRSARAYASIWTPDGSPLVAHGRALRDGVAAALGEGFRAELAMRYGEPAIRDALAALAATGVGRIVALPLFPQYATAVTGSVLAEIERAQGALPGLPPIVSLPAFYADPGFVAAFADVARSRLARFEPDFTLLSFHGLPERQIRRLDAGGRHCLARENCCDAIGAANADCYRAQCFASARALAAALGLAPERWGVGFQSRLGPVRWIRPYTDVRLRELAGRGVRRLAVLCPSFVADCLETLEEIGIRGREQWRALGGEELLLVPCPNAEPAWAETIAGWIRSA